nr:unnamed protein product [Callosobruchus analis]
MGGIKEGYLYLFVSGIENENLSHEWGVQASFHLFWVVLAFLFHTCYIQPKQYWLLLIYFTYFYNLYTIIKNINERAKFPEESQNAARTDFYIFVYMIADSLWLITSLFMLVGLCLRVKKLTSLCFYSPFLLSTATIILLDVDYTTWLKFIGVKNYKDFSSYNKHVTSKYIPVMTPFLLCIFFGKFLVFWIINVINFYKIQALVWIGLCTTSILYHTQAMTVERGDLSDYEKILFDYFLGNLLQIDYIYVVLNWNWLGA